jgi:opacity protein-like surface antigen
MAADVSNPPGFYLGLGTGINLPQSANFNTVNFNTNTLAPGSASFDTGWLINGSVGYKWQNGIRTEVEFGYRDADLHSLNGVPVSGDASTNSVMVNALYDIDTNSRITPYVGGGIGAGYQDWNNVHDATFANSAHLHDSGFQWQLIGGVSLPVDRHFSLFAEYRYIGLDDLHFRQYFFDNIAPVGRYNDRSSNILVGFRWHPGAGAGGGELF